MTDAELDVQAGELCDSLKEHLCQYIETHDLPAVSVLIGLLYFSSNTLAAVHSECSSEPDALEEMIQNLGNAIRKYVVADMLDLDPEGNEPLTFIDPDA